jgi:hypothetical protein
MKYINALKKFSKDNLFIDLAAAFAASLCASSFTSLIRFQNRGQFNFLAYARFILLAAGAYLTIALILHWVWTGRFRRLLPSWILIAVFGSLLFVCLRLTPGIIKGWNDPYRSETSFLEYISTEIDAARSVIIVLSLITLPVTGLVHYTLKKFLLKPKTSVKS